MSLAGKTRLAKAVEPEEGESYLITKVEEIKTQVQGFQGLRVSLKSEKKSNVEYATMLWLREAAGAKSKLGAFLSAFEKFFGSEEEALQYSNWVNHKIRIISWKPRAREIVVID